VRVRITVHCVAESIERKAVELRLRERGGSFLRHQYPHVVYGLSESLEVRLASRRGGKGRTGVAGGQLSKVHWQQAAGSRRERRERRGRMAVQGGIAGLPRSHAGLGEQEAWPGSSQAPGGPPPPLPPGPTGNVSACHPVHALASAPLLLLFRLAVPPACLPACLPAPCHLRLQGHWLLACNQDWDLLHRTAAQQGER